MRILFLVALSLALTWACPMFVEFFPDPTEVSDNEGEYVEIRLDEFRSDSLFVKFENRAALAFEFPSANRLILVHDSSLCARRDSLACGLLGSLSLPNSRESSWKLWAGSCVDSVLLPAPKPGRSLQRVGEGDDWVVTGGTPGTADPDYEIGIADCALSWGNLKYEDGFWKVSAFLDGCDSSLVWVEALDLGSMGGWKRDSLMAQGKFSLDVSARGALWLRFHIPEDAAPANDSLDTLLAIDSPLQITEIHHCPAEPMPEWVEVYNGSRYSVPLERLKFCGRGGRWSLSGALPGTSRDSLFPFETILVTKDTLGLRSQLGFSDVNIAHGSIGYLNNSSGSIILCFDDSPMDSVFWDKGTASCPEGFNPKSGKRDNSPGFQRSSTPSTGTDPFRYKLSTRVLRKKGSPLRVSVDSERPVEVQLLDSAGHGVWKKSIPSNSSGWLDVPAQSFCQVGICYVSFSQGSFEKVVGFVVRP